MWEVTIYGVTVFLPSEFLPHFIALLNLVIICGIVPLFGRDWGRIRKWLSILIEFVWKKTACFLQKEVIRYICHSINSVPSCNIFSFTINLLAVKTIFGRVSENFIPRNVLVNFFLLQFSSFYPYILMLHCDMNVHKLEPSPVYSNRPVRSFCC